MSKESLLQTKNILCCLSYLRAISLQTGVKSQRLIKEVFDCCKLQCTFKSRKKLSYDFLFKESISTIITSMAGYKSTCGLSNEYYYREFTRNPDVKNGDHISISPYTNDSFQAKDDRTICHYLQKLHLSSHLKYFSLLCHEGKKHFLELTEYFFKMRDAYIPAPFSFFNTHLVYYLVLLLRFCS